MRDSILVVEDDASQREMLRMVLSRKFSEQTIAAEHGQQALEILSARQEGSIKLVIMDLQMPVMGGLETLEIIKQQYPDLPVIMLTGTKDMSQAVEAMRLGATDFLSKPYDRERMETTVTNALRLTTLSKELKRLHNDKHGLTTFQDLIGYDGGLSTIIATGHKAAQSDIPVLLNGETGTGKEVFAKAIHGESARAGKAFIAVNCGAIPSQLVESTLFGHEKGAFTGATEKVLGKFREADGGTIFLDEVGELPLDTQVKLLRVLQQKEVEPVGAGKPVKVDVRILSATNRDLKEEIMQGRFREDLFFRLNVLNIHLPPLRNRKQDIDKLASHFIERHCAEYNLPPKTISDELSSQLKQREWPGNVRQLENVIKRAMVMSDSYILDTDDLPSDMAALTHQSSSHNPNAAPPDTMLTLTLLDENGRFKNTDQLIAEMVTIALEYHEGNVTRAAQAIGMAKSTFYKKIPDLEKWR